MSIKKLYFIIPIILILNLLSIERVNAVSGSIKINNDDTYTTSRNVTLTLSTSPKADLMCFANEDSGWSDWESFKTTKSWTLSSGDGYKTVYVCFWWDNPRDDTTAYDSIILDTTPPKIDTFDQPNGWQNSTSIKIKISVSDDGSGVNIGVLNVRIDGGNWSYEAHTTSDYTYNAEHGKNMNLLFVPWIMQVIGQIGLMMVGVKLI